MRLVLQKNSCTETQPYFQNDALVKTLSGQKVKFNLVDEANLETQKELVEGVLEFSLESKNLGERTIVMRSSVEKTGMIVFRQKGALESGFSAIWYPAVVEAKPELVILIK